MSFASLPLVNGPLAARAEKTNTQVTLFFGALVIYLVGQLLSEIMSPARTQLLQAVALVPLIWFGRQLVAPRKERDYFWMAFWLLMLNNVLIVLKGASTINYGKIKEYLFADFRLWPYLVPFAALFVRKEFLFPRLFKIVYWLGLAFMVLSVACWSLYKANPPIAEQMIWLFSSVSGFVLLTLPYHNMKRIIVAAAAILLALFISTMLARRNIMLTNINFFAFSFFSFLFFGNGQATKKILSIYGIALVIFAGIYIFQQQKNSSFKLITHRMQDDTRELVFARYFSDMQDHMWLGKGMGGTYYCPMVSDDPEIDSVEYRDLIECGYLQVILKGGYLNLILLLMVMLPAIYRGIFRSRNRFSKGCALLVLLWLIDMGPYGLPNLSLRYILVWICIGVCYTNEILLSSEEEIKSFLSDPKKITHLKNRI